MICEEFKGSKKDFKREKKIKDTTGSSRQEVERHRQSFVVGNTAVVAGLSKVSESTVEKFLGEKKKLRPWSISAFNYGIQAKIIL